MIGLDTNLVIRLLTRDDPDQLRRAEQAIERRCSENEPALINRIVLVEVVWVLSRVYKYSRSEIVGAVEALLQVRELTVESPEEVWEALHLYSGGNADFSDYFLSLLNRKHGCETTLTFDSKAARSDLFQLV